MPRLALCSLAALTLSAAACHHDGDAIISLVVTVTGSPPPVSALEVQISGPAGTSSESYTRPNGEAIAFPTTLSAELPAAATGNVNIAVTALDASGATVATGQSGMLTVAANGRPTIYVPLSCGSPTCTVDAGTGSTPDAGTSTSPRCGNGRVDPGETCDIAIRAGDPGACPPSSCDDGVACTNDIPIGSACTASCAHPPNTDIGRADGCCPSGATRSTDPDCSATCGNGVIEAGETCDTAIAAGQPGACPTPSECTVADPCALTLLVSVGTCQAICLHYQVTLQRSGDGCCPPGATNAVDMRLSDGLWRRRPARERVVRHRHRTTGAGKLSRRLRRRQRLHHRLSVRRRLPRHLRSRADRHADLGRRLLPIRRDPRHRHRLPRQLRRRRRRAG